MTIGPIPAEGSRNAAFPGAVLMVIGAYLLYWALNGWGLIGPKPTADTNATPASTPTPATTGGSNLA